jgi:hypothetical protein
MIDMTVAKGAGSNYVHCHFQTAEVETWRVPFFLVTLVVSLRIKYFLTAGREMLFFWIPERDRVCLGFVDSRQDCVAFQLSD